MTETLSALALVVAGLLWVRDERDHPRRAAVIFGLTIGAGALVHPSFLAYAPAIVVLSPDPLRRPRLKGTVTAAAIATACAFLPVLPWTLRNCRVMDRCTLISTNGGWNLAIGSFSRATGRFETLRASDGCAVVTGQVQQDECWRDLALATIKGDFWRWIGLVPKKLGFTFDHESFPVEYLHEADPDRWSDDRRRSARAWLTGAHRVWLTAAALGVIPTLGIMPSLGAVPALDKSSTRRRVFSRSLRDRAVVFVSTALLAIFAVIAWSRDSSPFYLLAVAMTLVGWLMSASAGSVTRWALFCLAATIVTHAVFFGEDRYHIVIVPMLCLLAARVLSGHAEPTFNAPHAPKTGPTQGEPLR
jgi:4-amino-4-deoxy-L-arabinose transferase-like glycosyltransferase